VVAEGVESEDQLRFLMRRRCDEAQGNYLGFPIAAKDFSATVQGHNGIGVLQSI
jgi:EAL domain-containing protein (putative c-di-GMP-specific phosphodiesterase class I)